MAPQSRVDYTSAPPPITLSGVDGTAERTYTFTYGYSEAQTNAECCYMRHERGQNYYSYEPQNGANIWQT